ncbi:MAG: TVP38/TMEM64 family protein [Proteobacteria bacterium]|nr:TVP38/TMEM64 family protein [Pseudomonadota bacterium]
MKVIRVKANGVNAIVTAGTAKRLAALGLPALLLVGLAVVQVLDPALGRDAIRLLAGARAQGAAGLLVVVLLQGAVAASGVLPASVLGVAAGALFGVGAGFAAAAIGTLAGAVLAFGLTRSFARPLIARLVRERPALRRLDAALAGDGWKLVCLLRISPVMPFAVTSYALGLSSVRFRAYLLGTLASLPPLLAYVVLGRVLGFGALHPGADGALRWVALGIGAAASLGLAWYVLRLLRRACALPAEGSFAP